MFRKAGVAPEPLPPDPTERSIKLPPHGLDGHSLHLLDFPAIEMCPVTILRRTGFVGGGFL